MFPLNYFTVAAIFFAFTATALNYGATPSAQACIFAESPTTEGYDVKFYEYDDGDSFDFSSDAYLDGGYKTHTYLGESLAQSDIYINGTLEDIDVLGIIKIQSTVLNFDIHAENFTAEISAYFYAHISGYYKFLMHDTDDSAALFFATEDAFICCTDVQIPDGDLHYNVLTYNKWHKVFDPDQYYYQYLEEGKYYPLRIVYTNAVGPFLFDLSIINPEGDDVADGSSGYIFSPSSAENDADSCSVLTVSASVATSSSSWTGKATTVSTYYPTGTEGVTVVTLIPDPTTIVSANFDGSTISSTFVTPTDAGTWTESIFYPEETVTSYVPWTGTETKAGTTMFPENPDFPVTIVVDVPEAITTTWTGNFTSTYTTFVAEDSDETIALGVEVPRSTEVVTDFWSGTTTSYSTEFPSDSISEVIVHDYVPQTITSGDTIYITTYWTGGFTSYSTVNPDNINGITIVVEIPQQVITETWTGVVTSTTFYCPYSGADSTPVVLVPSAAITPGSPEDCDACESSGSRSTSIGSSESSSTPSSDSNYSSIGFGSSSVGSSEPSFTPSSGSTASVDINYASSGNNLLVVNWISIICLLFIFSNF